MTRAEVLAELSKLGGVTGAAFVSGDGELLDELPGTTHSLAAVRAALSGYHAASRMLAELLGAEAVCQTALEFGGGAVLLTLLADGPDASLDPALDTSLSVVTLSSADDLGRVRFGLRRLLPELLASSGETTPGSE